jgi:uncharacterized FlaG/YvyC family protein
MTSLGHIDPAASAALATTPAVAPPVSAAQEGAPGAASGASAPAVDAPLAADAQKEDDFDERMLDRMALRLVKRDPGLAIERDEIVRRYIYRFLDVDSGDQIRQFPTERVLETMRALRAVSDRLTNEERGPGLAV